MNKYEKIVIWAFGWIIMVFIENSTDVILKRIVAMPLFEKTIFVICVLIYMSYPFYLIFAKLFEDKK